MKFNRRVPVTSEPYVACDLPVIISSDFLRLAVYWSIVYQLIGLDIKELRFYEWWLI